MKQIEALNILKSGHNVFLTGSAGSGKTFLLNEFITYLKSENIAVGVTASTGIAATHLSGRTIHSWCGLGIEETLNHQVKSLIAKGDLKQRLKKAQVLIIDEISMLSASRLDLVDAICQLVRKNSHPFGGLQIVLSGDFFQLPPVARGSEDKRFALEAEVWSKMNLKICYLEEQHRQEDKKFFALLNALRGRQNLADVKKSLSARLNKEVKSKIKPTKLYTHNFDVDSYNDLELSRLRGESKFYEMRYQGLPNLVDKLKGGCLAPEVLELKIGAVVMFVKNNFKEFYVNGTLGKIIGFDEDSGFPLVETIKGDVIEAKRESWAVDDSSGVLASISQIPLRLAWAITIHKSQGLSLDCAEIDLSKTFEYGMGYVALSRVRSLAGLKLLGLNNLALEVNEKMIEFDEKLRQQSDTDLEEFREGRSYKLTLV
ncbi:MAG: PIF1 family DEAD/DEAH box helicase [Candidatus Falkowbacteria bacterium]